jgi:hypothetical protein
MHHIPFRLGALFSSMSILIKDLLGKKDSHHLVTIEFKNKVAEVMKTRDSNFETNQFYLHWDECYINERNSFHMGYQLIWLLLGTRST